MTTYYYDAYGCVTTTVDPHRSTDEAPPTCPGGQVPLWGGTGWVCAMYTPPATQPTGSPYGTRITPLAFSKRIGTTRLSALYTLAQTNIMVEIFKDQMWGATFIDLADPLLATEMAYITGLGAWTAADVTAIISPPVQQSEVTAT